MKLHQKIGFIAHKIKEHGLSNAWRIFISTVNGWVSPNTVDPYDLKHGTDTAGRIRLYKLDIESKNIVFGTHYQPSDPEICEAAIRTIPIRQEEFCFVDLGAGKGRVLLVASVLPFKRIIGVEFARELVEIARKNLLSCNRAEVVCSDAATFEFPADNLVVYMFNPFERPVMETVLLHLDEAAKSNPERTIYIIYHKPLYREIILKYGVEVARLPKTIIYRLGRQTQEI